MTPSPPSNSVEILNRSDAVRAVGSGNRLIQVNDRTHRIGGNQ